MSRFILRRFVQALLTIFGIIFITFILFRQIAGDVSAAYVNQKLGKEARQAFYEKHKLNRPLILNYHTRLTIIDTSGGKGHFSIRDSGSSRVTEALSLHPTNVKSSEYGNNPVYVSRFIPVFKWNRELPEGELLDTSKNTDPYLIIELSSGKSFELNISSIRRISDIPDLIEDKDIGSLKCFKEKRDLYSVFNSQFFWHFFESITFSGKSYTTNETLMKIISERAVFSLSITVPAVVIGWVVAMMISLFVAYYNNTWIDRTGVLLAVLGMCIPYLAYMIIGQVIMFQIAPEYAAGLSSPVSVYIPIAIAVIAGTGRSVRFYRTIILD
ncbi:MAG: hypothetical protein ACOCSE_05490, partial [Chitinivibrionales bacterium]